MSEKTQYWRFMKVDGVVQPIAVGLGCIGSDMILPPCDGRPSFTGTRSEALAEAERIEGLLAAQDRSITTPWGATIKINAKAA